jgi:phospholipid/cholesterol/gamma-HCH transport system ATP-binding protein
MADPHPSSAQPILEFDHVSVAFDDVKALQDVSFRVLEGETRIILGAAGSGKTVLLKTAMALNCPQQGTVRFQGKAISDLPERELFVVRSNMGMLFQESALFDSMTIQRNVAYPLLNQHREQPGSKAPEPAPADLHKALERVREALRFVELERTLNMVPSELSGGMRRRVAIARAFVTRPPLLLYDSPTAGLDPITAHTIMALIIKERDLDNTTALVVTQRYQDGNLVANFRYNPEIGALAPAAGSVGKKTVFMVLKEGRLIFEGTQDELEASKDDYIDKFVRAPD